MRLKTILLGLILSIACLGQNLQVHYDFGEDRHFVTSTLEMFKPDDFGATFWFVDIDYADTIGLASASMAYWEIARYFSLPFLKNNPFLNQLNLTIQYNDGLYEGSSFGNVWLGGISLPFDLNVITLNADLLYRKAEGQTGNIQMTVTWYKSILSGRIVFTGFLDIWGQNNFDGDIDGNDAQVVIMTEPQFWYNVSKNLAIGSEIEISRNFIVGDSNWKCMPTIGLKWEF